MDLRTAWWDLLLFVFLLLATSICTEDLEASRKEAPSERTKSIDELLEESSGEDQFPLESATTIEPTTITTTTTTTSAAINTYQNLALSIGDKNVSGEFRPSVHLGEIKESRISGSPFNNVHDFKFDATVDPGSYLEHLNDFRLVLQPTAQTLQTDHQASFPQNLLQIAVGSVEEGKKDGAGQSGYVKFQDDSLDVPKFQYGGSLNAQAYRPQFAHVETGNLGTPYDLMDQQVYQNLEKPVFQQEAPAFLGKPSKFQSETQEHEIGSFSNVDSSRTPHYVGFYEHQGHRPGIQDFDLLKKPSNGVVYVQESSFLRTRKFPYPVYQPSVGYHQVELVNDEHPTYPVRKRISPWKKILHLIGAFLPLGLLVAALTPNIVKVNNTTDPNIVLSKWRVADLPVEHKQARSTDPLNSCEERSICDTILAGGDAGSTALQNILWNLATRTSTAIAKESGLQEIFEAVKKKDCSNVSC